ncbi:hypothetical protein V5799_018732 [Amblyomma americanum]|uniref:GH18 domain-containing protein n=1 Tax=Amblyomma americanum TaxID=6943 RepID=A0AAQ4EYW2_AMBAM
MTEDRNRLAPFHPTGGLPWSPEAPTPAAPASPTLMFRQVPSNSWRSAEYEPFQDGPPTHSYGSTAPLSHLPARKIRSRLQSITRTDKINPVWAVRKHPRSSQRDHFQEGSPGKSRDTAMFPHLPERKLWSKSQSITTSEAIRPAWTAWKLRLRPQVTSAAVTHYDASSRSLSTSPDKQQELRAHSAASGRTKHPEAPAARPQSTSGQPYLDAKKATPRQGLQVTKYFPRIKTLSPPSQPEIMSAGAVRSPPVTRVVVVSKRRDPSVAASRTVDAFRDILPTKMVLSPTTALGRNQRQDLHRSVTPSESPSQPQPAILSTRSSGDSSSPVVLPPATSSTEQDERRWQERRLTLIHAWAICGVAVATLTMPLGMLLLSYLATPAAVTNATPFFSTANTPGTTPVYTLPTLSTRTTTDPWASVPLHCRGTPRIVDNVQHIVQQRSAGFNYSSGRNIFCLYNNTRYLRGGTYDYLPSNMPYWFCENIVYWSFGVQNGMPLSRAANFDNAYGLATLKATITSQNATSKILVAVGGYREEYPEFSVLSKDPRLLSRFVGGILQLCFAHHLDGVVVHWVQAEPGCRGVDDAGTLHTILTSLQRAFRINGFRGLVTAIVPADRAVSYPLVMRVIDVADYIFIETHSMNPRTPIDYNVCARLSRAIINVAASAPGYAGNEHKICTTLSIAPWRTEALTLPVSATSTPRLQLSSQSQYGSRPGSGNIFEMCGSLSAPCILNATTACIAMLGNQALRPIPVYLFHNTRTLLNIFSHGIPTYATNHCALIVDLDLDNYSGGCLHYL